MSLGDPVLATLAIVLAAALVHSIFGFGSALVAMPLLTIVLGIELATPLVAFVALVVTVVMLWGSFRDIEVRAAWKLIVASAVGIPVGILVIRVAPASFVKAVLGVLLIAFSVYNVFKPKLPTLHGERWVYLFGFAAGVLGGAYNTNGPPVVLFGALKKWSPQQFRATIQGFFLPSSILICASHGVGGLWTGRVFELFAWSLPVLLVGLFVGLRLGRRIPPQRFQRVLYGALVVLGALLLV